MYDKVKESLLKCATLVFPKESTMCLLTDASGVGRSGVVTQVANWNKERPVQEQTHELLVCLSGTFTGSQKNWSVIEKEAFLIICACDKSSYLLLRPNGFQLYCDHRNLIYVFAPGNEVKKHIREKLLSWATKLMEYKYKIAHIEGESNVWADMVSRWAGNHITETQLNQMRLTSHREVVEMDVNPESQPQSQQIAPVQKQHNALRPLDDLEFEWPSFNAILEEQARHAGSRPPEATGNPENGWFMEGRLWIPGQSNSLLKRMTMVAHCRPQGHRGREATVQSLQRSYMRTASEHE